MKRHILLASLLILGTSYCMKTGEVKGERPTFFGTLTTLEGNVFNVTNLSIGRSRGIQEKILLYEKPKNLAPSQAGNILPVNPSRDLTTATLELQKISKISVPEPRTIWKWQVTQPNRQIATTHDYIELLVTWRSGSTIPYLLELGLENSRRPVKVFSDVIDKKMAGKIESGARVCPGINKDDLRKKGAPFQAIQELIIQEPCFAVPKNASTINGN